MKKIVLNSFLALAMCFAMASCDSGQTSTDAVETADDVNEEKMESAGMSDDMEDGAEFAVEAASGGMFEVEAGKLAQQKASSSAVKDFANKMVEDHGKANEELKALAAKKNITLPTAMSEEHQKKIDKLSGLSGTEFDEEYMSIMDAAHAKDVKLFEEMANENNADPEIKAFASKTLPVLHMHAEMADSGEDMAKNMDKDKDTIVVSKDNSN
jgi:putative membrane protein